MGIRCLRSIKTGVPSPSTFAWARAFLGMNSNSIIPMVRHPLLIIYLLCVVSLGHTVVYDHSPLQGVIHRGSHEHEVTLSSLYVSFSSPLLLSLLLFSVLSSLLLFSCLLYFFFPLSFFPLFSPLLFSSLVSFLVVSSFSLSSPFSSCKLFIK